MRRVSKPSLSLFLDLVAKVVDTVDVVADATGHLVLAAAADEQVGACAAEERIVSQRANRSLSAPLPVMTLLEPLPRPSIAASPVRIRFSILTRSPSDEVGDVVADDRVDAFAGDLDDGVIRAEQMIQSRCQCRRSACWCRRRRPACRRQRRPQHIVADAAAQAIVAVAALQRCRCHRRRSASLPASPASRSLPLRR